MKRTFAEERQEFSEAVHRLVYIIAETTGVIWLMEKISEGLNRMVIWWENRQR